MPPKKIINKKEEEFSDDSSVSSTDLYYLKRKSTKSVRVKDSKISDNNNDSDSDESSDISDDELYDTEDEKDNIEDEPDNIDDEDAEDIEDNEDLEDTGDHEESLDEEEDEEKINEDTENTEEDIKLFQGNTKYGKTPLDNCLIDPDDDDKTEDLQQQLFEVKIEDRITIPRLTKYERVRLLGTRTKQLSLGAPPLINNSNKILENKSPEEIALIELDLNMIPLKIKRLLPNNRYEIWHLHELQK